MRPVRHRIPTVRKGGTGRASLRPAGVALAWARDRDGVLVPVKALDAASRRARAPFGCPGCGDALVARLGAVRARHFAHRPGSTCPLTAPETALHFNVKARLLALCGEAFAGARAVTLRTRCAACRRPVARRLEPLGDAAVAEGTVGPLRADVLVTRRGAPSLALEVLVTHAVDAGKEAALRAAGVPVVEVDARADWERAGAGGPGAVEVVVHRALGLPPCPACQAEARAEADRALGGEAAKIAELESYRARGLLGPDGRGPRRGVEAAVSAAEVAALRSRFRCPDCGRDSLVVGVRLVGHPCPGHGERPVAWRGYDGRLAGLGWWKR
jgi:predicted RNA-binding Zn-ribbon protein involved in translation (DUF1610 family)